MAASYWKSTSCLMSLDVNSKSAEISHHEHNLSLSE